MHDRDYYDLDDGDVFHDDDREYCADCGDPAELCECSLTDEGYEATYADEHDTATVAYVSGAHRDLYPHMSDRDYRDCRDAGRVI